MASKPQRSSRLRRKDSTPLERLNLRIPKELAQRLRIRCVEERRSLADGVSAAIAEWLKG